MVASREDLARNRWTNREIFPHGICPIGSIRPVRAIGTVCPIRAIRAVGSIGAVFSCYTITNHSQLRSLSIGVTRIRKATRRTLRARRSRCSDVSIFSIRAVGSVCAIGPIRSVGAVRSIRTCHTITNGGAGSNGLSSVERSVAIQVLKSLDD